MVFFLQTFKDQIEKPDQYNGPLLAMQDTKTIFGNIPPIYEVHVKLKEDLSRLVEDWSGDASVGEIILKHVSIMSWGLFCCLFNFLCILYENKALI